MTSDDVVLESENESEEGTHCNVSRREGSWARILSESSFSRGDLTLDFHCNCSCAWSSHRERMSNLHLVIPRIGRRKHSPLPLAAPHKHSMSRCKHNPLPIAPLELCLPILPSTYFITPTLNRIPTSSNLTNPNPINDTSPPFFDSIFPLEKHRLLHPALLKIHEER